MIIMKIMKGIIMKTKLYLYKVLRVDDVIDTGWDIDHNFNKEFYEYLELRGYAKIDYYTTDTPGMVDSNIYCIDNKTLIKALELITTFEGEIGMISERQCAI